jgi:hypothetical protein
MAAAAMAMAAAATASVYAGLCGHVLGVAFVLRRPPLWRRCAPVAFLSIAAASAAALALWVPCLLLRLPPIGYTVGLDSLVWTASLGVMWGAQQLWPQRSGTVFFAALAACSDTEARRLAGAPVVRGLTAQLQRMVGTLILGLGLMASAASTAHFWLPLLAAGLAAIAAAPVLLLVFGAVLVCAAWLQATLTPAVAAVGRIGGVSTSCAGLLALAWLCGLVNTRAVELVGELCWCYVLSLAHGQYLLSPLSIRMSSHQWEQWCLPRRLKLAGFGLPVWATMRFAHPLLGLVLLEVQHGAAGVFVNAQVPVLDVEGQDTKHV